METGGHFLHWIGREGEKDGVDKSSDYTFTSRTLKEFSSSIYSDKKKVWSLAKNEGSSEVRNLKKV